MPYLLQLLGLSTGIDRLASLTPEATRARTFAILRQMSLRQSQQQPLLLVVENLHWIDPSSEEYLTSFVETLAGVPIMLLTTFRPGYQPPWLDKSYATQITLPRLNAQDSLTVLRAVLPQAQRSHPLVHRILEKAEGNPLFLEELALSVQEQGNLQVDLPVPDTIQGVLMARIDRLPPASKQVLQAASILGREVSLRLLQAIWEAPDVLESHIQELQRLELLYARYTKGEPFYAFKHALTQQVIYNSMLRDHREALHRAAGNALEALYAERLAEVYDRLAYHYARTDDPAKAVLYLMHGAEKAMQGAAHIEAVAMLQEARQHAERLPASIRDQRLIALVLRQTDCLHYLGRLRESLDLLLSEHERLERLQDPALAGPYYFRMGHNCTYLGEHDQAVQHIHRALTAATQCSDKVTMGKAYCTLAREVNW